VKNLQNFRLVYVMYYKISIILNPSHKIEWIYLISQPLFVQWMLTYSSVYNTLQNSFEKFILQFFLMLLSFHITLWHLICFDKSEFFFIRKREHTNIFKFFHPYNSFSYNRKHSIYLVFWFGIPTILLWFRVESEKSVR
jgi:hypothetical protein